MSYTSLVLKNPCPLCGFTKFDHKIDPEFFICLSCGATAPRNFKDVKYTFEGEDDYDDSLFVSERSSSSLLFGEESDSEEVDGSL